AARRRRSRGAAPWGHRHPPGVRRRRPARRRPRRPDRPGQPRDDPELRRHALAGPAEELLTDSLSRASGSVEMCVGAGPEARLNGGGRASQRKRSTMTELVHYGVADGVGTITLDSPHNRNALSRQLTNELFERLDRAAADDDAAVVVIRSADRVFCSGADLSEASEGGMEEGARTMVEMQRRIV